MVISIVWIAFIHIEQKAEMNRINKEFVNKDFCGIGMPYQEKKDEIKVILFCVLS